MRNQGVTNASPNFKNEKDKNDESNDHNFSWMHEMTKGTSGPRGKPWAVCRDRIIKLPGFGKHRDAGIWPVVFSHLAPLLSGAGEGFEGRIIFL